MRPIILGFGVKARRPALVTRPAPSLQWTAVRCSSGAGTGGRVRIEARRCRDVLDLDGNLLLTSDQGRVKVLEPRLGSEWTSLELVCTIQPDGAAEVLLKGTGQVS